MMNPMISSSTSSCDDRGGRSRSTNAGGLPFSLYESARQNSRSASHLGEVNDGQRLPTSTTSSSSSFPSPPHTTPPRLRSTTSIFDMETTTLSSPPPPAHFFPSRDEHNRARREYLKNIIEEALLLLSEDEDCLFPDEADATAPMSSYPGF